MTRRARARDRRGPHRRRRARGRAGRERADRDARSTPRRSACAQRRAAAGSRRARAGGGRRAELPRASATRAASSTATAIWNGAGALAAARPHAPLGARAPLDLAAMRPRRPAVRRHARLRLLRDAGTGARRPRPSAARCALCSDARRRRPARRGGRVSTSRATASSATWSGASSGRCWRWGGASGPRRDLPAHARGARPASGRAHGPAPGPHPGAGRGLNPAESRGLPARLRVDAAEPLRYPSARSRRPADRRHRIRRAAEERRPMGAVAHRATQSAKAEDVERRWYVVDATDKVLGRLATRVAIDPARQAPPHLHAARRHRRLRGRS